MAEASFLKPSETESLNYTQGERLLEFMRLGVYTQQKCIDKKVYL